MKLQTLGHATLVLREADGTPLLITDPWLLGSCYWRSWWLENPPSAHEIAQLQRARYCYLTHEHPDHFHPPSLRRLGSAPTFLTLPASAPEAGPYLAQQGLNTRALAPLRWYALTPEVSVLALPCLGGDSVLLIATPTAAIINLNDARPSPLQILQLRRLLDRELRGRSRILLASYSSAGLANSFRRQGRPLTLFDKRAFVRFVSSAARLLRADQFLPFASQVVYRRPDTAWANAHRVSFADLQQHFAAKTELVPLYSQIDLATGRHHVPSPPGEPEDAHARVEAELQREAAARFDEVDLSRLEAKLRALPGLRLLFPRGIGFQLGALALHYDCATRTVQRAQRPASFTLHVPALPVQEALASGHFSDLSIPMFTFVELGACTDPRLLYVFFLLVSLHDSGALGARSLWHSALHHLRALPPLGTSLAL